MRRPKIFIAATLIAGMPAIQSAEAQSPSISPEAVARVEREMPCVNAREVAELAVRKEVAIEEDFSQLCFTTQELGDGTHAFIISSAPGNGIWAPRPQLHFVVENERAILYFDSQGAPAGYHSDGPKWNGRYLLSRSYLVENEGNLEYPADRHNELYFWDGETYTQAHTVVERDWQRLSLTWVSGEAEELFRKAHVTWSVQVGPGDTLDRICRRMRTSREEVMRQNELENPHLIRLGSSLSYDSLRTDEKKHLFFDD